MTEDIEITLARRMGEVLKDIRSELDDAGVKRVVTFIFDRYGINFPLVSILPVPTQKAQPALMEFKSSNKAMQHMQEIHDHVMVIANTETQLGLECPICHKNGFKGRAGTAGHMIRVHHKTPQAYFGELKTPK